ncbi:ornithine decarboxylase, partial [Salmonella enterica subsp. enterica serovar Mississippi]|nr:ornithine decarboxylase [Salmonella enterica subsp. enterica serovar Mississippi]
MSELKIAVSRHCPDCFSTHRNIVNVDESRFIDVAAIVLSIDDIEHGKLDEIDATGYGIPVFVATHDEGRVPPEYLPRISGVFEYNESRTAFYGRQLETAASHYETQLRPP